MLSGMRFGPLVVTSVVLLAAVVSCTSTARVSDVYTALDGTGARKRNVFFTDTKEIHCVVELGIGRKGATVEALVRELQAYDFVSDKFFATDRVLTNVETAPTPSDGIQIVDVTLKPRGPDGVETDGLPFPPGHFVCEAYLDGKLEQTAVFNIDFPDCPASMIVPATLCFGFYKQNLECPRYGVSSRDTAKCHCTTLKGWECD